LAKVGGALTLRTRPRADMDAPTRRSERAAFGDASREEKKFFRS
jgi:hypothetical protein